MAPRKPSSNPEIELKVFKSTDEIDRAIKRLEQRRTEIEQINFEAAVVQETTILMARHS